MGAVKYRTVDVDGLKLFYREAGAAEAPNLLLLHGFPCADHRFRDLIPLLADPFHIIAPRSARVRPVRYAITEGVQLHVRQHRRRYRGPDKFICWPSKRIAKCEA
jgi:hypothetical protein